MPALVAMLATTLACGTSNSEVPPAPGPAPARDAGTSPPPTPGPSPSPSPSPVMPPDASGGVVDSAPAPDTAPTPTPTPAGPRPKPGRLVILGDSIAACLGVGDKDGPSCGPKKLHAYLAGLAPGISYENLAVSGADAADVPARQLPKVPLGGAHALVVIFVGGNDLRPYMVASDSAAEAGFATVTKDVTVAWERIFAFFADRARFPSGATLLLNNQYSPFDDCTAPPFFVSTRKHSLLRTYNELLARLARDNGGVLTDQYTPYLGHGHHYAVASCPHYQKGAAGFMGDLIHPNPAGHENLFQQWKKQVDGLYGARP